MNYYENVIERLANSAGRSLLSGPAGLSETRYMWTWPEYHTAITADAEIGRFELWYGPSVARCVVGRLYPILDHTDFALYSGFGAHYLVDLFVKGVSSLVRLHEAPTYPYTALRYPPHLIRAEYPKGSITLGPFKFSCESYQDARSLVRMLLRCSKDARPEVHLEKSGDGATVYAFNTEVHFAQYKEYFAVQLAALLAPFIVSIGDKRCDILLEIVGKEAVIKFSAETPFQSVVVTEAQRRFLENHTFV